MSIFTRYAMDALMKTSSGDQPPSVLEPAPPPHALHHL